ncbi:lipopolysaccharide biosynthesis protein [Tropicibacter sp. Alg240-R139]|uniref:lipopolysaccharide biosynthesis protein n=1 Tax=Tropicibacter sp. Alg240-R139 TaxID=2305991 RepID=UPI0013DF5E10|nr:lipopolysaccharide biosynthesis protein [Tropicibacter sp. Alg240-R139]
MSEPKPQIDETAPQPSLRRNVFFAAIGRGYLALTQLGLIMVTAHLGQVEDVGALTLATAVVTPLFFLASLGMREVHTVDDLTRFSRSDYVALRFVGGSLALALTVVIAFTLFAGSGCMVQSTLLLLALVRFFGTQSDLNHGMFQRAERLDFVAWSILARGSAGFLAFAVAFWFWRSLPLALCFQALAWALAYRVADLQLLDRLGQRVAWRELWATDGRKVLHLAWWLLPVGLALLLARGAISVPSIVLERSAGLAAVGVFGALAYVHTGLNMVANTLGSATAARLRKHIRLGQVQALKTLIRRLIGTSLALAVISVAVAWVFGAQILTFMFGSDYAARDLFTVIVIGSSLTLLAAPMITLLTAAQVLSVRLIIAAASFGVSLTACALLIPDHGAMGAAWAFVLTCAAQLGAACVAVWWCRSTIIGRAQASGSGHEVQG